MSPIIEPCHSPQPTPRLLRIVSFRGNQARSILNWNSWFSQSSKDLLENVQIGSNWAVCVIEKEPQPIETYFVLEKDGFSPYHYNAEQLSRSVESFVDIGYTDLSNPGIKERAWRLRELWGTPDPMKWNNQNFAVLLSLIITRKHSRENALNIARALLASLSAARSNSRLADGASDIVGTMLWGVVAVGISLPPGGIRPLPFWQLATGISNTSAEIDLRRSIENVHKEFSVLQSISCA
ncbi:uncharacterized protein A1O5_12590 [Cladophialophora psammophila CBS 110553]|uniref:Uncharacterized protein n=1 Tax=Cladophialophora psammophila CBS 110553 TaxID=1182543 RepID=W9VLC3_9EURO|nr:uncharacterized protein A1O5_12590 [Cladophialophora psammophila CBS 110553]EXJ56323.1 hypothetical protein A1O5_12590 [Cladophialophora psammophila CBS 110553]